MKIRLLVCKDCLTIEELPFFHGKPEEDVLLDHLVQPHKFPNGEEHKGILFDVEKEHWDDERTRTEIINQIRERSHTGLEAEFYATKATFQEDAMKCFNQHRRPDQFCIDWHNDRKRLGNPTSEGWKRGKKVFLCDFCPVASYVATQQRIKAGAYDE